LAIAFLGLGSNEGDREVYLKKAVAEISKIKQSSIQKESSIYETEPWGKKNQRDFLNQVIAIETKLGYRELFFQCQEIEKALGRKKRECWGPREIDIDLLMYNELVIEEESLCLPHRRLNERRFVLVPWAEIASEVRIPGLWKTVQEILDGCPDRGKVKFYKKGEMVVHGRS